jgi:hypothetical protein
MAKIKTVTMTPSEIREFRKTHIIKGDSGDGVPNIMSPDESIVNKIRQKPIRKDLLADWINMEPEHFCTHQMLVRYKRNEELINLDKIPFEYQDAILKEFEKPFNTSKKKILDYFIHHKCKNLMADIGDF